MSGQANSIATVSSRLPIYITHRPFPGFDCLPIRYVSIRQGDSVSPPPRESAEDGLENEDCSTKTPAGFMACNNDVAFSGFRGNDETCTQQTLMTDSNWQWNHSDWK